MNAENIAKRKKKAQTHWHGECHQLKCVPKTMRLASNVYHMNAKNRHNVGSVSHPAGCLSSQQKLAIANYLKLLILKVSTDRWHGS